MKTALAFIFSLVFVWTHSVQAHPGAGDMRSTEVCCECTAGCCAVDSFPESQPVSAAPALLLQKQAAFPAIAIPARDVPAAGATDNFPPPPSLLLDGAVPVYARNCVRLI
jgi:hypothetical protein